MKFRNLNAIIAIVPISILLMCGCKQNSARIGKDTINNDVKYLVAPPQCGSPDFKIPDTPPMPYLDYLKSFHKWSPKAFPPVEFGRLKFQDKEALSKWIETTKNSGNHRLSVWGGKTKIDLHDNDGNIVHFATTNSANSHTLTKKSSYWIYVVWESNKISESNVPQLGDLWNDSKPIMYALVKRISSLDIDQRAREYHNQK